VTSAISVFGNLTIDDLVFADGSTRWALPGGSAANAALGAALWARSASIVAPVGADYPVETLGPRIDLSRCRRIPRTLRNWGLYEDDGRRHFVSRGAARNWSEFSPQPTDASSGYQAAAHIAPLPYEIGMELIRKLRGAGTLSISLDVDDHDFLGKLNLDAVIELVREVDFFLPSRQDVLAIFPNLGPLEGLRELRSLARDVPLIAMKCGADGVIAHVADATEWVHIPAVPVEVVDATGAGDAFCGGVLAGFVERNDPIDALLRGAVSASFCLEGRGFTNLAAAVEERARERLGLLRQRIEFKPI
jgi:sugar/nucleoside kinase (ribokinase family)